MSQSFEFRKYYILVKKCKIKVLMITKIKFNISGLNVALIVVNFVNVLFKNKLKKHPKFR